jgi:hypothetical protein
MLYHSVEQCHVVALVEISDDHIRRESNLVAGY